MLVTKVFPRTAPYIMATAMAVGLGTTSLKAATNDRFEKFEPKAEMVKTTDDKMERGFPWLDVIDVGFLLAFLGLIKFCKRIEKKPDEANSQNTEKTEPSAEKVLPADEPVVKD